MKSRSVKVRAEVVLMLAVLLVGTGGCTQLDGYDRSYSVAFTDGERVISGGVTLRGGERQTPNFKRQTPNGPATAQQWWPGYGFNFGGFAK